MVFLYVARVNKSGLRGRISRNHATDADLTNVFSIISKCQKLALHLHIVLVRNAGQSQDKLTFPGSQGRSENVIVITFAQT